MKLFASLLLLVLATTTSLTAHAGVYADDLSRCLVEKTTKEDRTELVRWMFAAAAANPAVAAIAKVTPQQQEQSNKVIGQLITKLLTESCQDKTKKALTYEGSITIQTSFSVLGQVAATELFASPEVTKVLGGLDKYTDKKKLEELGKQ